MMTQDVKLEIIKKIECPTCKFYAWHFGTMIPVKIGNYWHHPSCITVKPRKSLVGKVLHGRRFF
jgi:hypothetical protein